jgi:hypothetical protein
MKTEITRTELKKIYDIACDTWKPKIEEFAKRTPFEKTIQFSEKEVGTMINACTNGQLPIVSKIFDFQDITDKTNNFKDVLDYLGEKDEEVLLYRKMLKADINGKPLYTQMLICWNRALNEKQEFKEDDYKWRIWWNLYPFGFCGVDCYLSYTDVPLALCFKNEKLARFAGNNKEYQEICKEFMY